MARRTLFPGVSRVVNRDGSESFRASGYDTKGRKWSKTFRSAHDANTFKAERTASPVVHGGRRTDALTLDEWFDQALARSRRLKPKTVYEYRSTYRTWIAPFLGDERVDQITRERVVEWIGSISERPPTTVWAAYRVLARTLSMAEEAQVIVRSPATKMGRYLPERKEARDDARVLTPAEVRHLASCADDRDAALILTMGRIGLRFGEAAGLQRADFEPAIGSRHGSIHVRRNVVEVVRLEVGTPKGGRARRVPGCSPAAEPVE